VKTLELISGVITKCEVKFPAGCHGLVKVRFLRSTFQLAPLSGGEWITGDNESVPVISYYPLEKKPLSLDFVACSPGTYYPHTITVRIWLELPEIATPWQVLRDFVNIVKRLIGV